MFRMYAMRLTYFFSNQLLQPRSRIFGILNLAMALFPRQPCLWWTKILIHNLLQLINRVLLSSIHPVLNNPLHRRADLLVAVQQINPAVLDALGLEQRGRDLRHRLAAHLAPAGLGLAELDLAGGIRGQCARPQVDPDEVLAPLGRLLVEGLVRGELGDVVVGEDLVVDFLGGLGFPGVRLACGL